VPVESSGGSGTRDAHWRESVFTNELMTGYAGPGRDLPLSRMTISKDSTTRVEAALYRAVKAYPGLRQGEVSTYERYEVFGSWHPSVTVDSLNRIVRRVTASTAGWEPAEIPYWNVSAGRLYFAGRLVKAFRRPAPNQRRILDAFQRLQWLGKIENPFFEDRIRFDAAAEALRNTTEALNDGHFAEGLIRFGTGDNCSSVYWKAVTDPDKVILLRSAPFDLAR
jgi:hypothetical protein